MKPFTLSLFLSVCIFISGCSSNQEMNQESREIQSEVLTEKDELKKSEPVDIKVVLDQYLQGDREKADQIIRDVRNNGLEHPENRANLIWYYATIDDMAEAKELGAELVETYEDDQLAMIMYTLTHEDSWLKQVDLLNWGYHVISGDVHSIAAISDIGEVMISSRQQTGEYWTDPDYEVKTTFERISSEGNPKWSVTDEFLADLEVQEGPEGNIYYKNYLYESSTYDLVALNNEGNKIWKKTVYSGPAIGKDGTLYIGVIEEGNGYLQAVDSSGVIQWSLQIDVPAEPVIGQDGTIYTTTQYAGFEGVGTSDEGVVYAANPDGTVKWTFEMDDTLGTPVLGAGDMLLVDTMNEQLSTTIFHAFSSNGKKLFEHRVNGLYQEIAAISDSLFLYRSETSVKAVNYNGKEEWRLETGEDIVLLQEAGDGSFYIASMGNYSSPKLWHVSKDGQVAWLHDFADEDTLFKLESGEDGVHIVTGKQQMNTYWMLNTEGETIWKEKLNDGADVDLKLIDGQIYVLDGTHLRVLNETVLKNQASQMMVNPFEQLLQVKVTEVSLTGVKTEIIYPKLDHPIFATQLAEWNDVYKDNAETFLQYATQMIDEETDLTQFEFSQSFEVTYNEHGLFSILHHSSEYAGGAHPIGFRESEVIDVSTGKLLSLKDLLGEKYLDIINEVINQQIDERGYFFFEEFSGVEQEPKFYLTDDAIVIYFDLYEYTPYSDGFPEFTIPFDSTAWKSTYFK